MLMPVSTGWVYLSAVRVRLVARPGESVSLRGNRMRGVATTAPLADVLEVLGCRFDLNDGEIRPGGDARPVPLAHIAAGHAGASNNRLLGLDREFVALVIDSEFNVVLGNMTRGTITVNGTTLPSDKLNTLI
jgi:hypothetical protein